MKNRKIYDDVLIQYNMEQHTSVSMKEDALGAFTPVIDLEEQIITLNPHIETMFTLFNMSTVNRTDGSNAIHHFLLYHLAMGKNLYAKAEELLQLLQTDILHLREIKAENKPPLTDIFMECQTIFLLMHEASHIFYHHHPDILADNSKAMKEHLQWIRSELDTDRSLLVRLMQGLIPSLRGKMEHSFDEAKIDHNLQEELLCDDAACRITFNLMQQNVPDKEQQAVLAAYTVYTLYYIEAQRTLENIYMTEDNQMRQRHLMFDTTRSTVLVNLIWDFIDPAHISTFKSLVNAISRQDRLFLMLSRRDNVDHMACVRLCDKGKYSLKDNRRLTEMYNEMIDNLQNLH